MDTTPATLLERVRNPGDREAWRRFVQLYTPLLYHWARGLGLQESDAADLLQDVFTILHRKLPTFTYDHSKSFRAWLRTITLNKWREHKRREAVLPQQTNQDGLPDLAAPEGPDPSWEVEYRRQLVRRALQIMQTEFQPATWKACWEQVVSGRAAAAVAEELGISLAAAYAADGGDQRDLRLPRTGPGARRNRPAGAAPSRLVLLRGGDGDQVEIGGVDADAPEVRCEWAAGPRPTAAVRLRIDPMKAPADGLKTTVHIRLVKPAAQTIDVSVTWVAR